MKRLIAYALLLVITAFTAVACGGSSSLAEEAETKAKKTCACTTFECTTEYIKWFNEVSITKTDRLEKLSESDRARYTTASLTAADCQLDLN